MSFFDYYTENAVSLQDLGSNNHAWPLSDIIKISAIARQHNLIVLGGDVFYLKGNNIDFTYDSWYYDGDSSEESVQKMIDYLELFQNDSGENLLFSVIIRELK